jgi:CheY-like chemotaxis protein
METPASRAVPKEIDANDRQDHATLHGWKEIALELDRSVRTVQRWERTLGLPVRRLSRDPRAAVFLFKEELRLWLLKVAGKDREREFKQVGVADGPILQSSVNKGHTRLLFVDDEPGLRAMLPVILQHYGFRVTVAPSVEKALEEIRRQVFDVLFCNLNIERKADGYRVIRAIREVNPQCLIIVRSSSEPVVGDADHHIQDTTPPLKFFRDHSQKRRSA